jgi:formylglycine-generating enzyme required for sulfatase activity
MDHSHPVATLAPNAWGLYDMSGNIIEWTWDRNNTYGAAPITDPVGGTDAHEAHLYRGGSWDRSDWEAPVYARNGFDASANWTDLGFRLVRTAPD